MPPHRLSYRPVVMGCQGAVASAHPLASMAGIQMLLEGGNAVDAAVAVASTLNVVEPFMSGAAGIGLMLISRRGVGEKYVLDFRGKSPSATTIVGTTNEDLVAAPKSCATPGNLGGWLAALERFGSMPRAKVFASAIQLADSGAPLTLKGSEFFKFGEKQLKDSPEAQTLYFGQGTPTPGRILSYKDLANTFRLVVEGGMEAFYNGPIARAIVNAVEEAGGWLSKADLGAFQPVWSDPISLNYRGVELFTAPPDVSAFQLLETLSIMEGYEVAGWGHNSTEYLHHLIESIKLATADRHAYEYKGNPPINALLSKAYATAQKDRISTHKAAVSEGERPLREKLPNQIGDGNPASFLKEQTTHFSCADRSGMVVSVTQTLGEVFGSGFAVPGTGLLLNNALRYMDTREDSPNVLRANHKYLTMMSPVQAFQKEHFALSLGTPGSYGILQTIPQMLMNALDFGLNIQEAIEQPRVRTYLNTDVNVEARISEDVRSGLIQRGHNVKVIDDWTPEVGGGQGITYNHETGVWSAGADPRRDGYALAF